MSFDPVPPPYNHLDPTARFLSSSALDFLLIELVPMSYRVTSELSSPLEQTGTGPGGTVDEDEEREAVFYRLEGIGYRVGQGLVERFAKDRGRFGDTLEVIKFVCKDLWGLVFRKQVDNLKTNHRGVYVLTDNNFRPLSRMSVETGGRSGGVQQAAVVRAQPFLWVPCGIVRGALAAMGIQATVQAETTELPGAVFQIKTLPAK
ncbi:putative trafficking protein particle complex subunit 6B [Triangularia setosa]|uniref:Trafficking protein particle complex subunit 6B n=1 Tax=Triangularia setosa TaxID=2587417 RepID=A0AAN7AAT2_9PEZI|nr:putative trafficking protein particle complex subunit 6B [Podospora setosa]